MGLRWYVVQTRSQYETVAEKELRNQNFNVFHPKYIHKSQSKRSKEKLRSLFPAYLFIELDITKQRWKSVNGTRGVVGLVGCYDDYVVPLPRGLVEGMKDRADDRGLLSLQTAVPELISFTPGMQLGFKDENYSSLVGTYCNHSEKRVTLLLTLLNRKIEVSLPIEAVRPITPFL